MDETQQYCMRSIDYDTNQYKARVRMAMVGVIMAAEAEQTNACDGGDRGKGTMNLLHACADR